MKKTEIYITSIFSVIQSTGKSPAYSCVCVCEAQIDLQGSECAMLNNFSSKMPVQFARYKNVIPNWDKIQLPQIDPVLMQSLHFSYVNCVVFVKNETRLGLTISTPLKMV